MSYGFKPARRFGVRFELARSAVRLLEQVNSCRNGKNERGFEQFSLD